MKRLTLRPLGIWSTALAALLGTLLLPAERATAANGTWNGGSTADGNWSDSANWASGTVPGSVVSTSTTDIGTFNGAVANGWGSTATPVVIDSTISASYLHGIYFGTSAVGSYTIGSTNGNAIHLNNVGTIQILATAVGGITETVNAPLVFGTGTASQTGTIQNVDTDATATLVIGGAISGGTTGAVTLTLGGANTGNNIIGGAIANGSASSLAIVKSGSGTWTLSNASNAYTGSTTINDGTLRLGATNAIPTTTASLAMWAVSTGSGTAILDLNGFNQTVASLSFGTNGAFSGASYKVVGSGTLTLNGTLAYTNSSNPLTATISVNTLDLGGAVRTVSGNHSTANGTGADLIISSNITDGGLNKNGTATLLLSGNNTYTGVTTDQGTGTLMLGSNTALGSGSLTMSTATIQSDGTTARVLANAVSQGAGTSTYGTAATGNLTFGTLTLTSASGSTAVVNNAMTTFVGDLGSTQATSTGMTKQGTGAFIINGGTATTLKNAAFDLQGGMFAFTTTAATNVGINAKLDGGVFGGNGAYAATLGTSTNRGVQWAAGKDGGFAAYGASANWGDAANNLTVAINGGATLIFGSTASFLSSGSALILGNASSNGTVTFQNGLDLAGTTQTIQTDRGASAPAAGVDAVASGAIGNGALNKTGAGTLQLTGNNTYAGGTTITNGTLLTSSAGGTNLGTGAVNVNASAGAIATFGATGTIANAVTVGGNGGGTSLVDAAGYGTIGSLSLTGGLAFGTGGGLAFELNSAATTNNIDLLVVAGTLTLGNVTLAGTDLGNGSLAAGTILVLAQTGGLSGTFSGLADGADLTIGGNQYQINYGTLAGYTNDITLTALSVPEPSVWLLAGCGAVVLGFSARMRRVRAGATA